MNRNVTLSIPADLLRRAKVLAAQRGTSLSGLLASTLADIVKEDDDYENARRRALAIMATGFDMGTNGRPPASRDELHER